MLIIETSNRTRKCMCCGNKIEKIDYYNDISLVSKDSYVIRNDKKYTNFHICWDCAIEIGDLVDEVVFGGKFDSVKI